MARRNYDNKYPSVTTILGVLRKIGLEMWFKYNDGKWCDAESKRGREGGTDIHNAIEQFINTGEAKVESEYPEEVTRGLNSFMLFKKEHPEIEVHTSEVALTSEFYKYNGIIDAPEPPILVDWKSGNCKNDDKPKIYDEAKAQVAAYVKLWNENNIGNEIHTAHIVALAKDAVAYNLYTMEEDEINEWFNEVFLSALKIKNHEIKQKQIAKEKKNAV